MTAAPALGGAELRAAILEQMVEALIVVDTEGAIRLWNPGAERIFGFSAAEAIGAGLALIVPPKLQAAHDQGFRRALASAALRTQGRVLTTRATHKQGSRLYVDFSFGLLQGPSGAVTGVFAIGRDVTARFAAARSTGPGLQCPGGGQPPVAT